MRLILVLCLSSITELATAAPGEWPEPRQNSHLTGVQTLPGAFNDQIEAGTIYDLGRTRPQVISLRLPGAEGFLGVAIISGQLHCYEQSGRLRWKLHPAGLNFESIAAAYDLDGDEKPELLLQAGRSAMPYGAAVLVDLETGTLRWRYDVEPMSYAWYLHTRQFLPGVKHQQIVVLMHAYPPDPQNGYIALFDFPVPGEAPVQRWRYDFDQYTCFPSLLQSDLDGDMKREIVVETHSRMWYLDAESGAVKHFAQWDVSPANMRSYGLIRFLDLNGDHRDDFLCIADFAQHHEVLLNQDCKMVKAWHHGWQESVTTGKVASTWPEPPNADVDGDGDQEILVSMYNSEDKPEWLLRVYDAITGELQYRVPGILAVATGDIDKDGRAEVLANRCADPTKTKLDGAILLGVKHGKLEEIWDRKEALATQKGESQALVVQENNEFSALTAAPDGTVALQHWDMPSSEPPPDFSAVPPSLGPPMPQLLAANLLPGPENELLLYRDGSASVLQIGQELWTEAKQYPSACLPVIADFDGDNIQDLALATVSPTALPTLRVICPAQADRLLWEKLLPSTDRQGLPAPRTAYLRAGRFTGGPTPDLYFWAGTPMVRSTVVDGRTGNLVWDRGEVPGGERYCGASVNLASVTDFDADGKEDLVFTNPDYYCVASGPTGELLLGPAFPPTIFSQPSQGLYTLPAILPRKDISPLVALVSGHYFQGVMTLQAEPLWYKVPGPGEARQNAEGFLQTPAGEWLMGFGRQSGVFACINVADGTLRWEFDAAATTSDVIACDVDNDGQSEFVFGTSHGELIALGDGGTQPRIVFRKLVDAGLGAPIAADLDNDGASEIIALTADGRILLFDSSRPDPTAILTQN